MSRSQSTMSASPKLPSSLASGIDAGAGYSIYAMTIPSAAFVDGLHDLRGLNQRARELFGEQRAYCRASAYLPAERQVVWLRRHSGGQSRQL